MKALQSPLVGLPDSVEVLKADVEKSLNLLRGIIDTQAQHTATLARVETGQGQLSSQLEAMKRELLAELNSMKPPGGLSGGRTADESTQRDLVAAVERVAADAATGSVTAQGILERETPADIAHYLDARRQRLEAAQATLNQHVDAEKIQLDRELAAVAYTTGQIDRAQAALERILAALPDDLAALNSLSNIAFLRGEFDSSVRLSARVAHLAADDSWRAISLGNLGNIEYMRGNLNAAEAYQKDALAINERLGRLEGMAVNYSSLGLIEDTHGNLETAETYHRNSLAINEKLGLLEGMAADYNNLGEVQRARGNLESAESYYKNALAINEKLGRLQGVAIQSGNLGIIEASRGNWEAAEAHLKRAMAIDETIGRLEGVANHCANLGNIEFSRGNAVEAEVYLTKAEAIFEKLGKLEAIAATSVNLGTIKNSRGNPREARRLWTLARDLYRKIGAQPLEAQVQGWLDKPK